LNLHSNGVGERENVSVEGGELKEKVGKTAAELAAGIAAKQV
jgi:hypothetical protein